MADMVCIVSQRKNSHTSNIVIKSQIVSVFKSGFMVKADNKSIRRNLNKKYILALVTSLVVCIAALSPANAATDNTISVDNTLADSDSQFYYPYKDGVLDAPFFTLNTKNSNGEAVPFKDSSASVYLDNVLISTCTIPDSNSGNGSCSVDIQTLTSGNSYNVKFDFKDSASNLYSKESRPFSIMSSGLDITRSSWGSTYLNIYPIKDGYNDTTTFYVNLQPKSWQANEVKKLVLLKSGSLTLKYGSKTIKTWKFKTTSANFVWNGKVGGKIKTGTYKIYLKAEGIEGDKISQVKTIRVSKKKLYSASRTVALPASQLMYNSIGTNHNKCEIQSDGSIRIANFSSTLNAGCEGYLPIPTDINNNSHLGLSIKSIVYFGNMGIQCSNYNIIGQLYDASATYSFANKSYRICGSEKSSAVSTPRTPVAAGTSSIKTSMLLKYYGLVNINSIKVIIYFKYLK